MQKATRRPTSRWPITRPGWATAALLLCSAPLAAQEAPQADTTRVHQVRPGDTLWDLARQYLSDPFRWRDIFQLNRDVVENPNWIFPRERLRIPSLAERQGGPDAPPIFQDAVVRTVFWPPEAESAGPTLQLAEEAEVPVVSAGDFYRAGLLVPESSITPLGRLVELVNPSLVTQEIPALINLYDRVYMTLAAPGAVRPGDRLHLLRPGRRVERYGRIFESTGLAQVVAVDGNVATVQVNQLFDAVTVGDIAVALPEFRVPASAELREVTGPQGRLIAFEEPHPLYSLQDLGFVDLGEESGVNEGDELVVVLPPERRSWGVRPEIVVARLQVVRTSRRTAAVQVVGLEHPALEPGLPVRLIGKTP